MHQLRASLDNLVWELVLHNGLAPSRSNAFPIFDRDTPKVRKRIAAKLRNVGPEHAAAIEACQPYHWQWSHEEPLAPLEFLWSQDKHRLLLGVDSSSRPLNLMGISLPGFFFSYEIDGKQRPVLDVLRVGLAAVGLIVDAFVVATKSGQPANLALTPESVRKRILLIRERDATSMYKDDQRFLAQFSSEIFSRSPALLLRTDALLRARRLMSSPIAPYHLDWLPQARAWLEIQLGQPTTEFPAPSAEPTPPREAVGLTWPPVSE